MNFIKRDRTRGRVSFLNVLLFMNICAICLVLFGTGVYTRYTDSVTNLLGVVLGIITHFVLLDGKHNQNPLLAVFGLELVIFFELGIFALKFTEYSYLFQMSKVKADDFNYALLFIICAVLLIWRTLHFSKRKVSSRNIADFHAEKKFKILLSLVYASIFLHYASFIPQLSSIQSLTLLVFNSIPLLLFTFVYLLVNYKVISNKYIVLFIIAIAIQVVIQTLGGSRSGIFSLVVLFVPALLVLNKTNIKIRYFIIGAVLLPVMVFIYSFSSQMRSESMLYADTEDKIALISRVSENISSDNVETIISPILGRMAYVEASVTCIKEREGFSSFLNPIYCFKSVVDNVLTPGFDVFNVPRMSICVQPYYNGSLNLSKTQSSKTQNYLSLSFTMFGESYAMFYGWIGLLAICLFCYYIRYLYLKFNKRSNYIAMSIVVYLFYTIIISYGFDWFLLDTVTFIINYYVAKHLVRYFMSMTPQTYNSKDTIAAR